MDIECNRNNSMRSYVLGRVYSIFSVLLQNLPVFSSDAELTTAEVFACQLIKDWQIASEKEGIPEMPLNFFLKHLETL